jgi:hypothetical protein
MVQHQDEQEKCFQDDGMDTYWRRDGPRFTWRTVMLLAVLVVLLMTGFATCNTLHWHPVPIPKIDTASFEMSCANCVGPLPTVIYGDNLTDLPNIQPLPEGATYKVVLHHWHGKDTTYYIRGKRRDSL